jgi:hypothetical protein
VLKVQLVATWDDERREQMALVQIRVRCDERFRECPGRCWGCRKAQVIEVKNLSGKPIDRSDDRHMQSVANGEGRQSRWKR